MRHRLTRFLALPFLLLTGAMWAQAAPQGARCTEAVDAQLRRERTQLQQILSKHHGGTPVDGRFFGLPEHDFDDASNITVRQRQAFRRMSPTLSYPDRGALQYPRWAFSLMNRQDYEGTVRCGPATAITPAERAIPGAAKITPTAVIGPNINVSKDSISEAETYLAIDPANPQYLVGASNINLSGRGQMMYRSSDFGSTWSKVELVPTRKNHSDPGVAFTSTGTVYTSTLDYTSSRTQVKFYKSTDHGATWPTQIVVDDSPGNDKELAAGDYQTGSSCKDQIYVGWDDGKAQYASSTTAPNSGIFRPKTVVQSKGATIAADLAVGPPAASGSAAPVYYAWTSTANKTINFSKSTDCGATWSAYKVIATTKDAYDYGIPAQCVRRALIYPTIDVDRSNSPRRGWIYVVWNDFTTTQSNGCILPSDPNNANIWFMRSADGGATWSTPVMVNANLARVDHFNQWMNVDDADGTIHISWRDTRNDPNRQKTDVYYTRSTDGGFTFTAEVKVTSAMSDETTSGASPDQYGDYEGLAVRNGSAYPFWTDRRVPAPEEIFTAKVTP